MKEEIVWQELSEKMKLEGDEFIKGEDMQVWESIWDGNCGVDVRMRLKVGRSLSQLQFRIIEGLMDSIVNVINCKDEYSQIKED